jgi:dTDP-4-dehydrorhamnose reductase
MQILLFGKSGQVGWELQRSLTPLGELIALDVDSRQQCGDFTRLDDIAHTVRAIAPDVIVNAAAYTAVDKAESEPELVRTINALAPGILAREARKLGSWLIHYSTDYVFDGSGSKPWVETDPTGPLSVYGLTKLECEEAIRASGCHHLIFRTSWVYAARGGNFARTMLRLAQERERVSPSSTIRSAPLPVLTCWQMSLPTPSAWPCSKRNCPACTIWLPEAKPRGTATPVMYWI